MERVHWDWEFSSRFGSLKRFKKFLLSMGDKVKTIRDTLGPRTDNSEAVLRFVHDFEYRSHGSLPTDLFIILLEKFLITELNKPKLKKLNINRKYAYTNTKVLAVNFFLTNDDVYSKFQEFIEKKKPFKKNSHIYDILSDSKKFTDLGSFLIHKSRRFDKPSFYQFTFIILRFVHYLARSVDEGVKEVNNGN